MNKLSSIKIPFWLKFSRASILFLSAFIILMISNFISNNIIPSALQIISYVLLLITICCCYEAYFKIRRNKGYIYIALICFLLLLPGVIQMITAMFSLRPAKTESVMQHISNTSISQCKIKNSIEIKVVDFHLPLIELFLLLAVFKFSIKDDEDKTDKTAPDNPGSPDLRSRAKITLTSLFLNNSPNGFYIPTINSKKLYVKAPVI